ncbi:MAG TPA: gliding motility lipoprotein GldB [Cyclobacteriaceae bacterium]|nr:gliding motility lipoprotein GldB [Cyclobacteriaceae bacterium]
MKPILKLALTLIVAFILYACGEESEKEECAFIPETSGTSVELEYKSLSDSLVNLKSKAQLVKLLGDHSILRDYFFKREQYPNDSVFVNELYRRYGSPHIDTLLMETHRVFGDESELKNQFTEAFKNLRYYYPDARIPKIETVVSGFDNDMYVSDSLIIVSLDYFLGPKAKYRPNMYEYLLRQYGKENIVPSCLLLYGINGRVNQVNPEDNTILADMIAYGKSFYFAKQMMPCTPDSVFIWYTAEEMKGARSNQDLIWARFIEDKILYETSHMVKQKYLGDRPQTVEVGEKCPGRIAQWVGWEIVKKYMENHPDVSLPALMQTANADKIFKESRYKPERQ